MEQIPQNIRKTKGVPLHFSHKSILITNIHNSDFRFPLDFTGIGITNIMSLWQHFDARNLTLQISDSVQFNRHPGRQSAQQSRTNPHSVQMGKRIVQKGMRISNMAHWDRKTQFFQGFSHLAEQIILLFYKFISRGKRKGKMRINPFNRKI